MWADGIGAHHRGQSRHRPGAYNASKFAIEALADALRVELCPWKLAVILVEPGATDTDMWRGALDVHAPR